MDKINNQKKKLIIAITLLIIIVLGLGITYAWLIQIVNGEKIQSMRVGTFRFIDGREPHENDGLS